MRWTTRIRRRVSRRLNAGLGGDPAELLCSRLYREKLVVSVLIIDLIFLPIDRAWGHCRKCHEEMENDRACNPDRGAIESQQ